MFNLFLVVILKILIFFSFWVGLIIVFLVIFAVLIILIDKGLFIVKYIDYYNRLLLFLRLE